MKKRIIAAACAMLAVFAFASCKEQKEIKNEAENIKTEENKAAENKQKAEKESSGGFTEIELDVKPLGEYDENVLAESAAKFGFENAKLFHAFANAIDKEPAEVSQQDIDKVHYIAIGPEGEGEYSLFVGYVDYVDLCFSDKTGEPDFAQQLSKLVMMSKLEYDTEKDTLGDLGSFTNVEMFEIYDVNVDDVSFIKNYKTLAFGFFRNNGITDVSSLTDYRPASLIELDFTGNEISDWSPLEDIKSKITVYYEMTSGIKLGLEEYLKQKETPVEIPSHESAENGETNKAEADKKDDKQPEKSTEDEMIFVDENGNPADFGSLFD